MRQEKPNKPRKNLTEMIIKCLVKDVFLKFHDFDSLILKPQTTIAKSVTPAWLYTCKIHEPFAISLVGG